ncbi:MAG: hypothetical protein M1339_02870, partial [Bacteroidetes bacterium]|nr:hypothetical protein [Bacteroidota bacterium]
MDTFLKRTSAALWITLLLVPLASAVNAQPYYYFCKQENITPITYDLYRTDLQSGNANLVIPNVGRVLQLFQSPDQSQIFLQLRGGGLSAIRIDSSQQILSVLGGLEWIFNILDAPVIDRIYVLQGTLDETTSIIVLRRSDYSILDTIPMHAWGFYAPSFFLSRNNNFIYGLVPDTVNGTSDIITIETSSNSVVREVPFSTIPPMTSDKAILDARNGIALIGYTPDPKVSNYGNVTFDPTTGAEGTPVFSPWNARALLSVNCNYIILQQIHFVMDNSVARIGHDVYLGTVYVFNAKTGELTQRLSLPPGGKILVIGSSPQTFYYYNDSTNTAIAVSDTVVTPTGALIDTLISLKHQAVAKGWLKDDRNRGHDIDDMMRGNEWYKEGEAGKFRSWEVGKDWQFDHDWNNGIVEVLDKRLEMAKRVLDRGDSVMARRNLEIFVMEVELLNNLSTKLVKRGEEPIITSEGYLSLKLNAEYV